MTRKREPIAIGTDSAFKDAWLRGAARALFACDYADACDRFDAEHGNHGCDDCPEGEDYCDRCEILSGLPRAGSGQDWCDIVPDPPIAAYALAGELWAGFRHLNPDGAGVYSLARLAALADGATEADLDAGLDKIDPEEFGFDLAMMAMGTGASWFDRHKPFPIKCPNVEVGGETFALATYQGEP